MKGHWMSFILSVHPKWAFYRPGAVVSIVYMVGMCNGIPKFALFCKNLCYPFVGNYLHTTGQTSGIWPYNPKFYTSFYRNYQILQTNGSKAPKLMKCKILRIIQNALILFSSLKTKEWDFANIKIKRTNIKNVGI